MAYCGFIEEIPENLKRTVLGTFDFGGRSTRTELFTFMFVPQIVIGVVLLSMEALVSDFDAKRQMRDALTLLLTVPCLALLVRRLHDQDRTGWWAILLLVVLVFAVVSDNGSLHIAGIAKTETPWWLGLLFVGAIIALWVLSLWPPSPEANRYGPNPRLDEVELPA